MLQMLSLLEQQQSLLMSPWWPIWLLLQVQLTLQSSLWEVLRFWPVHHLRKSLLWSHRRFIRVLLWVTYDSHILIFFVYHFIWMIYHQTTVLRLRLKWSISIISRKNYLRSNKNTNLKYLVYLQAWREILKLLFKRI